MIRHANARAFFLSAAFFLPAAASRGQVFLQASGLADPDTCPIGGAGDNDSDVEPGERINMSVGVDNFGTDDAHNVRVTTSTTTPGIVILTAPPISTAALVTPGIPVITIPQIVYTVDACTVPCGSSITFRFDIESDEGNFSNTFTETVPAGASCNRCVTGNLGSCCHDDGRCSECTEADCTSRNWAYAGDGTDCTTDPCTSACCNGGLCTPDRSRSACEGGNGTWRFPPTGCSPNPCIAAGACCVAATCTITTPAGCSGNYRGDGTICSPNPCSGACCDPVSSTCSDGTPGACTANGGDYQGDGTTCSGTSCTPPRMGACCAAATCTITTQAACAGSYRGDDSDCSPNPCSGACCDPVNGNCSDGTPGSCNASGGTYRGDGTTCSGTTCPLPGTGACCTGTSCALTTPGGCAGTYQGNDTLCQPNPCAGACCSPTGCLDGQAQADCTSGVFQGNGTTCASSPCTGACCQSSGACAVETEADCTGAGGSYRGNNSTCTAGACRGACCPAIGGCADGQTQDGCQAGGGLYQDHGSSCATSPCPGTGACCDAAGVCAGGTTRSACESSAGNTYQGDGSTCPALNLGKNSFWTTKNRSDCPADNEFKALWQPRPATSFGTETRFNLHQLVGFANRSSIANPFADPTILLAAIPGTDSAMIAGGRETCVATDEPAAPETVAYYAVFQANRCTGSSLADP